MFSLVPSERRVRQVLPSRHSLFWRLAVPVVLLCLVLIWLSWTWGRQVERRGYFLDTQAQAVLRGYAADLERAWNAGGEAAVDDWLARMRASEQTWMVALDGRLQPLGSQPLSIEEATRLTFQRGLDWPVSNRSRSLPYIGIPFPEHPADGRLVLQLPQRFKPAGYSTLARIFTHGVVPAALALLLCGLLYRQLIHPLARLREHANALRADDLGSGAAREVSVRRDELGELGRAFDHMAQRLSGHVEFQRQLLRDLSHELRTPLSRLRVAAESAPAEDPLRLRLEREVEVMQRLVANTLELAWMDTERPRLPLEDVAILPLWELLVEDAGFESGWAPSRFHCEVPADCVVRGHLNGLAQALENLLRNAIRHSPEGGCVRLLGQREGDYWHLCLADRGPGVEAADLERIFLPFTRLSAARSGEGFGLGLSIARSAIRLQGGELWAERGNPGLRMHLRLPAA
ncbi:MULTISPECIES: sensor histidine kinase [Pseudomonas]|uniref:HAMP domain-containing sensor histidine kinase n=1 Tax=Pseudomonas TaxID=286 RepID=UPI0002A231D2|nr:MULTISPECIES: sensor histidine kinase [unclassified Pseudomonas]MBB1606592.1 two-component sensor histidine kinase [Pseudomonas sp. UMC76]MBB1640635.1 two-component sensor histidine kinase [Pseudomonas sp. UME83]NTX88232.1 sensor histidine kinase [Pseudomonas sp. UMA643]NTY18805.1 sensor histidine kinase [Pseudomonas sp. UMC3103]NTY23891.1 sensor histidine kinase [Pseudomonas sp. UMA603]